LKTRNIKTNLYQVSLFGKGNMKHCAFYIAEKVSVGGLQITSKPFMTTLCLILS